MTEEKNRTLYLECTSGISGDMLTAALLDLGAEEQELFRMLKSLPVKGFRIQISRVKKSGLDACDFDVLLDSEHENHDHDMVIWRICMVMSRLRNKEAAMLTGITIRSMSAITELPMSIADFRRFFGS